jgi:L-ascorbate metabolism protein UlaG (beta-lactamase superfamily)
MEDYSFGSVTANWLGHASVKLRDSDGFTVYIDPWSDVMNENREWERADVIISTHDHFDHFDKKMIQKLKKDDTVLVVTAQSEGEVPENISYKVIKPGTNVKAKGKRIKGVHGYNREEYREPDKIFHKKGFSTGVVFELDGQKFYHSSDTDPIPEMDKLKGENIDVAFLPVGGHYTMNQEEAVEAVGKIEVKKVVPIHYGHIDGTTADPQRFKEDVEEKTSSEVVVLTPG